MNPADQNSQSEIVVVQGVWLGSVETDVPGATVPSTAEAGLNKNVFPKHLTLKRTLYKTYYLSLIQQ